MSSPHDGVLFCWVLLALADLEPTIKTKQASNSQRSIYFCIQSEIKIVYHYTVFSLYIWCVQVHMPMWKPEVNIRCLSLWCSTVCVCVCVCVCVYRYIRVWHGEWKSENILWQLASFIMWNPGIKLRSAGWEVRQAPTTVLTSPIPPLSLVGGLEKGVFGSSKRLTRSEIFGASWQPCSLLQTAPLSSSL